MSDDAAGPVKPRLAISIDHAQAILDRGAPGSSVTGAVELYGGEIGAVFELARKDAPSCILKVYPASMQWKMAKEVRVLGLLRNINAPVPHIFFADDSRSVIDLNFVLMTKLPGNVLGRHEAALSEAELFAIHAEMGACLRNIHDITLDSFGYIGPYGVWTAYRTNRDYLSFQFAKKLGDFRARGGDTALADRLETAIADRRHLLDGAVTPRLCHYDFHAGNVLVTSNGAPHISGIVDFENAIAGDPLMDIARALFYFTAKDEPKRNGLLAGYGAIGRADWREAIDLYRLYGTLELWCWFAEIGRREALAGLTTELERVSRR
jgi:aminoglycoside phosphotransferase (APT) family kinase protein